MNPFAALLRRVAELERRQSNIVRFGTVAQVDTTAARVRVTIGPLLTAWLPWITHHAGANARAWSSPAVGEQVVVLSPSGELATGCVLPSIFCAAGTAPEATENVHAIHFPDGAFLRYDYAAHTLHANLPGGTALLDCTMLSATVVSAASIQCNTLDAVVGTTANLTAQTINITGAQSVTVNTQTASVIGASAISLTAPAIAMTGAVTVAGTVAVTGDVTAGAVSLMSHIHGAKPPGDENEKTTPPKV